MSRVNNGIMRHLEELTLENERLKEENKNLRTENRKFRAENDRLRKRIDDLETAMDEKIAKTVEEAVAKATAPLSELIISYGVRLKKVKHEFQAEH